MFYSPRSVWHYPYISIHWFDLTSQPYFITQRKQITIYSFWRDCDLKWPSIQLRLQPFNRNIKNINIKIFFLFYNYFLIKDKKIINTSFSQLKTISAIFFCEEGRGRLYGSFSRGGGACMAYLFKSDGAGKYAPTDVKMKIFSQYVTYLVYV